MATKQHYQIRSRTLENIITELNFSLSSIADRLDKIEGNRGTSTVQDGLTIESNDQILHGFNTQDET